MAVMALTMTIAAAQAQQNMHVWKTDGTHVTYLVSEVDSVGFYTPSYTLSVTTEGDGTVTGAGEYKMDETATLTATPAAGYKFTQWSDGITANPREIMMTADMSLTAVFVSTGGNGGGIGVFSIRANKQVTFSPGNLQYQASTGTWRFAENQWDYAQSGWQDLFGWGTGNAPTKTSTSTGDYSNFIDWGMNVIYDDDVEYESGTWYTMSRNEWVYLFNTRDNAGSLWGQGTVCGVSGVIILPDDWVKPSGVSFYSGASDGYSDNTYTATQWGKMQGNGAVFLPAAGYRSGTSVSYAGSDGYYWSSTAYDSNGAYYVYFYSGNLFPQNYYYRRYLGLSVRLVRVVQN